MFRKEKPFVVSFLVEAAVVVMDDVAVEVVVVVEVVPSLINLWLLIVVDGIEVMFSF